MSIVVGVDAGGTRTVAVVADDGRPLARAEGPSGAVRPGRAMAAAGTIATAVRAALVQTGRVRGDVLVVGASGVGRDDERQALRDALRMEALAERLVVTTDIEIALVAAFGEGPGIVLLAGTGSFAVGRDRNGVDHRQGGYGWRMGDERSAYAVGEAALRAVSRAEDGRGPATALSQALRQLTRSMSFNDLVRWSVAATPTEVASLAAAVLDTSASGDEVARGILSTAAEGLARLAAGVRGVFPPAEPVPVALAGGFLSQPGYRAVVSEALARLPGVAVRDGTIDPVTGALALARRPAPAAAATGPSGADAVGPVRR
jgi:N-acetylglucosamine kinase-like BadF-type ATPase